MVVAVAVAVVDAEVHAIDPPAVFGPLSVVLIKSRFSVWHVLLVDRVFHVETLLAGRQYETTVRPQRNGFDRQTRGRKSYTGLDRNVADLTPPASGGGGLDSFLFRTAESVRKRRMVTAVRSYHGECD